MKRLSVRIEPGLYRRVRQYQLDQAARGRKSLIGEAVSELLDKGLPATSQQDEKPAQ